MSKIKLYNTLSRKKEIFKPLRDKKVNIFVCGPTVYDLSHLGHAKTYVQFDFIIRYLKTIYSEVFYLQNITDIDDKIIRRATDQNVDWKNLARRYEKSFLEDMKKLNVISVDKYARATDYVSGIISQVKRLIEKGYTYRTSDGWYFDLSKDKDYGKLARRKESQTEDAVSRIDENKEKKNKGDFCLWKFSKKGEPVWESKYLGDGRPGWHIEDTAITEKEFGPQYDIHGGGMDLIFPHHEAEIAQMESISGKKPLVRYWMHTGFLEINSEKMGKSKKNFYTIREIFEMGYRPHHLRYFFLSAHYRKPLNFTLRNLDAAKNAYNRLKNIMSELKKEDDKKKKTIESAYKEFQDIINDDFNTPRALSYMWDILRDDKLNDSEKYELVIKFDEIFGLDLGKEKRVEVPEEIRKLSEEREKMRKDKKFKEADKIRDKIYKQGFVLEDTEKGFRIKKR
ncbi:MAG: cysteine--tRNA ligase [Candidatus Pacearchaeota archaeon]